MVSEEMPALKRGMYVAILEVTGGLGGIFAALVHGGIMEQWGWRGLYWIGGAPLVLVPIMFFFMKETTHFRQIKANKQNVRQPMWGIWKTPSKKYLLIVGALWFLAYLSYAAVVYTWPAFAAEERGWSEKDIGVPMAIASVIGMLGYLVCGFCLDKFGRRKTGIIFFAFSAAALVWTFTSTQSMMIPSLVASMFFIFALLPICSTYNAELFPTEVRASAMAWGNYMLGRPAQVVGPFVTGTVGGFFGSVGIGASVLAVGPFLAVFVVMMFLPETKGVNLDKVH
jgi:putative MFS transporter